jgi:putative membrane protein
MKAEHFFSDQEKQLIAETIGKIEKETAGEIAVMVVDGSDSYPESLLAGGLCLGLLLGLIVSDRFFKGSLWVFLPLWTILGFLCGWAMGSIPGLQRLFIFPRRREEMVQRCALRSFFEKGLYRTREQTGVLFFISLFERRVWILADKGIYAKIPQQTLQTYAADIAKGIKNGRSGEALCRQIEAVGAILTVHFPVRPDDINELPDTVIVN